VAASLCATTIVAAPTIRAADGEIEEIVVTGSRIARPDFESASPIVTVDAEAFARTGATAVDATLNRLPQFTPAFTSTSNNPGNDGQANLQLRGLGTTATLVLVDGRRLIPANTNGVVDLNLIPPALVQSVEVVSGGASAVYGSDAIAGVVNLRLRDDFDGIEIDAGYGQTERGDAEEYSVGVTAGSEFADGRGQLVGYLGYSNREAVTAAERRYSRYALGYAGPEANGVGPGGAFLASGSLNIEEGRAFVIGLGAQAFTDLFASYGYAPGSVPVQRAFGFNADRTLFTTGTPPRPLVANFRGEADPLLFNPEFYSYNFATDNYLQLPLERYAAYLRGEFDFDNGASVFGQALLGDYSVSGQLAPTPINPFFVVPAANPYVPADLALLLQSRPNPHEPFRMQKRLSELGPRRLESDYDSYQVTVGLRGPVLDSWDYEVYLQYGENEQVQRQYGNALLSRIEELSLAADGGMAICGGFDPFGLGSISASCASYLRYDARNRQGFEQSVIEATLQGPLLRMPAGDVRAVFGVMHKRDETYYRADPQGGVFLADGRPDLQGFNASDDVEGEDYNTDLYLELLVPLLAGVKGVHSLETVLGYRHAEYDSVGGADAYKAELIYRPIERLRLRGSLQHAVRAASVLELYQPQLPNTVFVGVFGDVVDPCEAASEQRNGPDKAAVEALCLAQGVPPALLADFADQDGVVSGFSGGNPDLEEEAADSMTLGAVLQSWSTNPWLEGLQVAVDWYRIDVEDAITEVGGDVFVPGCYDPTFNPGFSAAHPFCNYFSRDPQTGEMFDVASINRNIAGTETSGVDLQLDWRAPLGAGQVGLNVLVSWLDYLDVVFVPRAPVERYAGTVGEFARSSPEWKANLSLEYSWRGLMATLQWRYIDAMQRLAQQPTDPPSFDVPSYDYVDLILHYGSIRGCLPACR
jgi:outer membrane receptor protein involved in Fe transport